jgi:hypothetical protein
MISMVIATDMTYHFSLKDELDALILRRKDGELQESESANAPSPSATFSTDKDRELLLKTILHIADISNPAKEWLVSKKWSDLVILEFFEQVQLQSLSDGTT